MNKIKLLYAQVEKTLASAKFAVVIILIFAIALVIGTFIESYNGTDYVNRAVYKAWWFMLIQGLMFLSIFFAVVVRLPLKKRLYGFYTIHAGLMMMFVGSVFTYINGIDGSIQILPNTPAKKIMVNEDYLKMTFPSLKKAYKLALPYKAGAVKMDKEINGVKVKQFLPFADKKLIWEPVKGFTPQIHSTQYLLFNENMSQKFVMSLDPNSDFKSTMKMGLLNLNYMPMLLEDCMVRESASNLVIWNLANGDCFVPEERKLKVEKTPKNHRFLVLDYQGKTYKFFPEFSPVAVKDDLTKDPSSPFRILSRQLFEDKPTLFLFGESVAFYKKRKKKWVLKNLKNEIAKLPYMGFKLQTLKHSSEAMPVEIPVYVKPVQDNNKIIRGGLKAVEVEFQGKSFWVRNDAPLEISNGSSSIRFEITPKEINLPYQITLERFKMNKDPGTNNPASYESFVQLLDGRTTAGIQKHHVFMNNPLKYDDFTFYQSSYFPIGPNEQYGSVLSVNYDPGRFFKYLASILIVFGSIWHFVLRRKKTAKG